MVDLLLAAFFSGAGGVLAGWIIASTVLFERRRERHRRAADILNYAIVGAVDQLDPAFGAVPGDDAVLTGEQLLAGAPEGKDRKRMVRAWQRHYWPTCNQCAGFVFVPLSLAVWVVVAMLFDGGSPVSPGEVVPVLLGGWLVHVVVTGAGNRTEIW